MPEPDQDTPRGKRRHQALKVRGDRLERRCAELEHANSDMAAALEAVRAELAEWQRRVAAAESGLSATRAHLKTFDGLSAAEFAARLDEVDRVRKEAHVRLAAGQEKVSALLEAAKDEAARVIEAAREEASGVIEAARAETERARAAAIREGEVFAEGAKAAALHNLSLASDRALALLTAVDPDGLKAAALEAMDAAEELSVQARAEASETVEKAQALAEKMVSEARSEAEMITSAARRELEDLVRQRDAVTAAGVKPLAQMSRGERFERAFAPQDNEPQGQPHVAGQPMDGETMRTVPEFSIQLRGHARDEVDNYLAEANNRRTGKAWLLNYPAEFTPNLRGYDRTQVHDFLNELRVAHGLSPL